MTVKTVEALVHVIVLKNVHVFSVTFVRKVALLGDVIFCLWLIRNLWEDFSQFLGNVQLVARRSHFKLF